MTDGDCDDRPDHDVGSADGCAGAGPAAGGPAQETQFEMQRKVFKAEFNAKVALEALVGRKTVNEMAGAHEVHPNPVTTWKREAQEGLKALFERQGAGGVAARRLSGQPQPGDPVDG